MKRYLIGAALACMALAASAETINVIMAFSGGGQHKIATAAEPTFAKNGVTSNVVTIKACSDRFKQLVANPKNTVMYADIGDILYATPDVGANCPPLNSLPFPLEIVTSVYDNPLVLMNAPTFAANSYEKVMEYGKTGKKIRIGFITIPSIERHLKQFAARNPDVQFAILPYVGSVALRAAIAAGDVDLYYGASMRNELLEKGSTEIANGKRTNTSRFIGDLATKKDAPAMVELVSETMLVAKKDALDPVVRKAIKEAMVSDEVVAVFKSINGTHHGINTGVTGDDTIARMKKIELGLELAKPN